ncbi:MAG: hypothetical protein ACT4OE_05245 [Sphingosinicella sp.]
MRWKRALLGIGAAALVATGAAVSAQQNSGTTTQAPNQKERLICRSTEVTGKLAARRRQCFTRAEWDRIAEAARKHTEHLQGDNATLITGN